jgi:hypothetical protein
MTQTRTWLASGLADRCRVLQLTLASAAAERRTFTEFVARPEAERVDWEYLYQDFLSAFAPERRRALGVYYTPVEVVRAQVRLAADLLEQRLECRGGYADPRVVIVDPAAGSGAYPLAVVADARDRAGRVPESLSQRLRLLEPMVGAATIARARLAHALGGADGVHIAERDALEGAPLRLRAPIVVCLGNPPYRRHHSQAQPRARAMLADFFEPGAGLHAKNLYNDYVYFWRWAVREVFELRGGPGIVSFVTASSYLRGPAFAGMRSRLRAALDELWIIDLEGDQLAARRTENVFPIRTPVAIAMGIRYSAHVAGRPAAVHYTRLTGNRSHKLAALDAMRHLAQVPWQSAGVGPCLPFVPNARGDYATWPKLTDLFPWQVSGAQLKRTWPIAATPAVLRERWVRLLDLPTSGTERATAFKETRDRDLDSTPPDLCDPNRRLEPLRALRPGAACLEPVQYAYRSFDRHWVLPDARLGDFMRPTLWRSAGPGQIFLTSLLTNVLGPGPAAVATALVPDLDCFRGSFGARAVIPLWSDAQGNHANVAPRLLQRLTNEYGFEVSPGHFLAYCYALLGTRGYQARFEEELRTPGPRVPLTADAGLFKRAAALGQRLLWLHTYGQRCVPAAERPGAVPVGDARSLVPVGTDFPRRYGYDAEHHTLHLGEGSFGHVAPAIWAFSVSGLRVVAGWLGRRVAQSLNKRRSSALDALEPRSWSDALGQELLELLWVIEATLDMEADLDSVLAEIVATATSPYAAVAT